MKAIFYGTDFAGLDILIHRPRNTSFSAHNFNSNRSLELEIDVIGLELKIDLELEIDLELGSSFVAKQS